MNWAELFLISFVMGAHVLGIVIGWWGRGLIEDKKRRDEQKTADLFE